MRYDQTTTEVAVAAEPFNPPESDWWKPFVVAIAAVMLVPMMIGFLLFMAAIVAPFAIIVLPFMAYTLFWPRPPGQLATARAPARRLRYAHA
jgi:hypothetical protein